MTSEPFALKLLRLGLTTPDHYEVHGDDICHRRGYGRGSQKGSWKVKKSSRTYVDLS